MSKESRFISRVLRHAPEDAGLTLGAGGWVSVADLLRGMRAAGHRVRRDDLIRIVEENDKRRFTPPRTGGVSGRPRVIPWRWISAWFR